MPMETERLLLRRFTQNDVNAAHELFSDEEAMRLDGMYPPLTKMKETEDRINSWIHSEKHLAIVLKETGELLGYIVIHPDSEEGREDTRELGFALISRYRGNHYNQRTILFIIRMSIRILSIC